MTRDELSKLASGDRVILTRDDGSTKRGHVDERQGDGVWVSWDNETYGWISYGLHDAVRKES